eukprot:scaffold74324_cov25-Prasinocladus_malaysianus.AAC.1
MIFSYNQKIVQDLFTTSLNIHARHSSPAAFVLPWKLDTCVCADILQHQSAYTTTAISHAPEIAEECVIVHVITCDIQAH